jgi:hypothetical protein
MPPRAGARGRVARRDPDRLFAAKPTARKVPFDFVLDEIAGLAPWTRPMFGCTAVYVDERIVFVLREKAGPERDNGVWIATERAHHESLRRELPSMRSIEVLAGGAATGWQVIPADADDFEEAVLHACALVLARDPRIGKVPKGRRRR